MPPLIQQKSLTRPYDRVAILVTVSVVLVTIVWALREPAPSRFQTATAALTPEKIPLVTGDEPLVDIFTKPGCPVCHMIPGIPGATGQVGPPLILGKTGEQRLKDPGYRGEAETVHQYIVESVLEPQRFVVQGYPAHAMPTWYGSKLSALALEKIAAYLEHQTEERSAP
jgi:hypothetical protein